LNLAPDGFEAVNVVGKNGYLILDIIAYKRDIPPFDLEIINGNFDFRNKLFLISYLCVFK
jgi:hypothetical protein